MPRLRASQPTAAIVGAGLMGRWHAAAAHRAGGRLVAIIDPDLSRARGLSKRFPGCAAGVSFEAVSSTERPNVVHVCTPAPTHDAITRAALLGGSHVIVEKPLAPSARVTAELLRVASEQKRLICPVHQFVFQRGVQQAIERRDELGVLLHVTTLACSAGADGQSAAAADAIALEILPHPLSLVGRFIPGALDRLIWSAARPRAGELLVTGHDDRVTASFLMSMHSRPTTNQMTVLGTRGAVHLDLFHGFASFESGPASRAKKMRRPFDRAASTFVSAGSNLARRALKRQPAYAGLWELVDRFYRAIEGTKPPPFDAAEILAVARAVDDIRALVLAEVPHASAS